MIIYTHRQAQAIHHKEVDDMYNRLMNDKELNVKAGDIVSVMGNRGIVTEVFHHIDTEWNGTEYVKVADSDSTCVRVHFTGELAKWGQYQDGVYGGYTIVEA